MPSTRGSYRYTLDLPARIHTADHGLDDGRRPVAVSVAAARVVDLSRTGAGLVCTLPLPFDLDVGLLVRLAVDDAMFGHPVIRQWFGRVTHRHDRDGRRLGIVFNHGRPSTGDDPSPAPPARGPSRPYPVWPPSPRLSDAFPDPDPATPLELWWPFGCLGIPAPSQPAAFVALAGLAADQWSKAWSWSSCSGSGSVLELVPDLLAVSPEANPGALASLAGGLPLTAPLCALTTLALAILAHRHGRSAPAAMRKANAAMTPASLAASIGGGLFAAGLLGNSADRLALGYVRDFLVSGLFPHWAFNLADLFLVLGALTNLGARLATPAHVKPRPADGL
jgi:lipoprotein signal peptidase